MWLPTVGLPWQRDDIVHKSCGSKNSATETRTWWIHKLTSPWASILWVFPGHKKKSYKKQAFFFKNPLSQASKKKRQSWIIDFCIIISTNYNICALSHRNWMKSILEEKYVYAYRMYTWRELYCLHNVHILYPIAWQTCTIANLKFLTTNYP